MRSCGVTPRAHIHYLYVGEKNTTVRCVFTVAFIAYHLDHSSPAPHPPAPHGWCCPGLLPTAPCCRKRCLCGGDHGNLNHRWAAEEVIMVAQRTIAPPLHIAVVRRLVSKNRCPTTSQWFQGCIKREIKLFRLLVFCFRSPRCE